MTMLISLILLVIAGSSYASSAKEPAKEYKLRSIGWVRKAQERTLIVLDEKYQPGLLGLDGFSHVYVFYWLDRNDSQEKRSVLQVHPRGNRETPLTGVFATRSPARPNLIALSLCKIIEIKGNSVEIDKIDAFPDTPVLDIKPFIPRSETRNATVPGWITN